jgi:hypothetical protein
MVGSLLIVSGQYMFAQNQPSPQEKSSDQGKSSTQEKGGEKKAKSSAESCDGALDIVPVKSMSFSRKRRQAKSESTVSADAKPDKASDSKEDVKPNKPRQNEEKP